MGRYWLSVFSDGWATYLSRLKGGTRQVIGFLIQTAIVLGLLYFIPWFGDIQDEARLVAATVGAVLVSGFLLFLGDLLSAPMRLQQRSEARILLLETALRLDADVDAMKAETLEICERGRKLNASELTEESVVVWKNDALKALRKYYDINFVYSLEHETSIAFKNVSNLPERFAILLRDFENIAFNWASRPERNRDTLKIATEQLEKLYGKPR